MDEVLGTHSLKSLPCRISSRDIKVQVVCSINALEYLLCVVPAVSSAERQAVLLN